jgi:ABC-type nitrate/sulfonate/bicarbonate transport system permease component
MTTPLDGLRGRLGGLPLRLLALAGAVAGWQLATSLADSLFFPTPVTVMRAFWNDWLLELPSTWEENLQPSLGRLVAGYLVAAVGGISAGVAIGRSRSVSDYLEPIVHFVRAIPPPALLPLFFVLLGIGDTMKIALIATGVFPPILLNAIEGVQTIDPLYLDTARSLRIGRMRRLTHVILPAAGPKIFAGLRISMSIAVILMVVSEMFAATDGLGFRVLRAQRQFKSVDVWAGLVMLGLVGASLNVALGLVERWALRGMRAQS